MVINLSADKDNTLFLIHQIKKGKFYNSPPFLLDLFERYTYTNVKMYITTTSQLNNDTKTHFLNNSRSIVLLLKDTKSITIKYAIITPNK
jgi:hypothetical protein